MNQQEFLQSLETDPEFREQVKEVLKKPNESDKDVEIFTASWPALEGEEFDDISLGSFTIALSRKKNEWSGKPLGQIAVNKRLLKSLLSQLIDLEKRGII